ncbi:MAG: OmpA family protein [Nitrososphaerales archaeon]
MPAVVALSLLGGVGVVVIGTPGAQADYYIGCGYGYGYSGNFGFGVGYGYGYGLNGIYGYGNGSQVCPPSSSSSNGGGSYTPPTSTTTTTQASSPGPTTTIRSNPPKGKKTPHLLGLRVYFANWSAVLTPKYKKLLNQLAAEVIADHTTHLTVIGYCSVVGTPGINGPLSVLRAQTVKAYLLSYLAAHGYTSITFTIAGDGVLKQFANYALDRVVIITG